MTYDELSSYLTSFSNRSDLTADLPVFISMAEDEMSNLRVRQMVKRATASIDKEYSEAPTDFLLERTMTIGADEVLFVTVEAMEQMVFDNRHHVRLQRKPRFYTVDAGQFRFYPAPDQAYVFECTYYGAIPPLTEGGTPNWIARDFPNAYRFGVMWGASLKTRDNEAIAIYKAQFDKALADITARFKDKIGRPLRADPMFTAINRRWRHGNPLA